LKYTCSRRKYIRGERLIDIRNAKVFRTTSNEALCIVADTISILLKIVEAFGIYNLRKGRGNQTHAVDREVEIQHRQHPADEAKILVADEHKDQIIHAYTDGSKTQHNVGSVVALFIGTDLALQEKFKLDDRFLNNQAEQMPINKALEKLISHRTPPKRYYLHSQQDFHRLKKEHQKPQQPQRGTKEEDDQPGASKLEH